MRDIDEVVEQIHRDHLAEVYSQRDEARQLLAESEDERKRLSSEWLHEMDKHRKMLMDACALCGTLLRFLESSDLLRAQAEQVKSVAALRASLIDVQRNIEE